MAAGDVEGFAGDPGRILRGEENRGWGDVLGLADPAERSLGQDSILEFTRDKTRCVEPLRLDHAGIDGVDANLARPKLLGDERATLDGSFGAAIHRSGRRRESGRHRTYVDDRPPPGRSISPLPASPK